MDIDAPGATYEYADERFKSPRDAARYWRDALDASEQTEREWAKQAGDAAAIYEQTSGEDYSSAGGPRSFNILHSNVHVIVAAAYNSTPLPDVRDRGRLQDLEEDPITKAVAEVMELGIAQQLDTHNFDGAMLDLVTQAYVAGRGVMRLVYEPFEHTDQDQQTKVVFEEITTEVVDWRDFRRGPAKVWRDVPWVGFRKYLSREDIRGLLAPDDGEADEETVEGILRQIAFEAARPDAITSRDDRQEDNSVVGRAECWEIWDKEARLVWWFCPTYPDGPLSTMPDPFGMVEFFPCPEPLIHTKSMGSLVPRCPYEFYRAQAEELERTSERIEKLTGILKYRGIRASEIVELDELPSKEDGEFVPSRGALTVLAQGKGLDQAIWAMPVQELIVVLRELVAIREQQKAVIYEITGIADIMRGATDADETLGAQQIKAQWGSLRVQRFQREVQRVCRDLFRKMAHIIANVFNDNTLQLINGRPLDPQVIQVMRNDFVARFRVDVETDSTIRGDLNRIQTEQTNFLQAAGQYVAAVAPVVASPVNPAGFVPPQVVVEVFTAFARSFRLGRQVEDVLSQLSKMAAEQVKAPPPQGPSPEEQKMQAEQQKLAADQEAKQADMQFQRESKMQDMQLRMEEKRMEMEMRAAERAQEMQIKAAEAEQARRIEAAKMALEAERMDREDAREAKRAELEGQKLVMQDAQAKRASDTENARQYLKAGLPPGFDHNALRSEIESELEDEMEKGLAMLAAAIEKLAAAQSQQTEMLVNVMTAPKEVIRDGSGKAVGVRTQMERVN